MKSITSLRGAKTKKTWKRDLGDDLTRIKFFCVGSARKNDGRFVYRLFTPRSSERRPLDPNAEINYS